MAELDPERTTDHVLRVSTLGAQHPAVLTLIPALMTPASVGSDDTVDLTQAEPTASTLRGNQ